MTIKHLLFVAFASILLLTACNSPKHLSKTTDLKNMMIRLSEIEIELDYLQEYLAILQEESAASMRLEPGVISIYPMYQRGTPNQIRILEIYVDKQAYESHLKTPHFQHYKTTTLKMVKALRLIDMDAIDPATMPQVFQKIKD